MSNECDMFNKHITVIWTNHIIELELASQSDLSNICPQQMMSVEQLLFLSIPDWGHGFIGPLLDGILRMHESRV